MSYKHAPEGKTPETDEQTIDWADFTDEGTGKSPYVYAEFAQSLERERDALQWQITCSRTEREEMLREIVKLRALLGLEPDQKVEEVGVL